MIEGYKAFNFDHTNKYGQYFEEGKIYHTQGPLKFGPEGNGYHFCKYLGDSFRYFDKYQNIVLAKVIGFGNYKKIDDVYNGYYDMYVFESIKIIEFLSREKLVELILKSGEIQIIKILMTFKLSKEELSLFFNKFHNNIIILKNLLYYQCNDKNIFHENHDEVLRKVRKYNG